jgi:hypothetical protein
MCVRMLREGHFDILSLRFAPPHRASRVRPQVIAFAMLRSFATIWRYFVAFCMVLAVRSCAVLRLRRRITAGEQETGGVAHDGVGRRMRILVSDVSPLSPLIGVVSWSNEVNLDRESMSAAM